MHSASRLAPLSYKITVDDRDGGTGLHTLTVTPNMRVYDTIVSFDKPRGGYTIVAPSSRIRSPMYPNIGGVLVVRRLCPAVELRDDPDIRYRSALCGNRIAITWGEKVDAAGATIPRLVDNNATFQDVLDRAKEKGEGRETNSAANVFVRTNQAALLGTAIPCIYTQVVCIERLGDYDFSRSDDAVTRQACEPFDIEVGATVTVGVVDDDEVRRRDNLFRRFRAHCQRMRDYASFCEALGDVVEKTTCRIAGAPRSTLDPELCKTPRGAVGGARPWWVEWSVSELQWTDEFNAYWPINALWAALQEAYHHEGMLMLHIDKEDEDILAQLELYADILVLTLGDEAGVDEFFAKCLRRLAERCAVFVKSVLFTLHAVNVLLRDREKQTDPQTRVGVNVEGDEPAEREVLPYRVDDDHELMLGEHIFRAHVADTVTGDVRFSNSCVGPVDDLTMRRLLPVFYDCLVESLVTRGWSCERASLVGVDFFVARVSLPNAGMTPSPQDW